MVADALLVLRDLAGDYRASQVDNAPVGLLADEHEKGEWAGVQMGRKMFGREKFDEVWVGALERYYHGG